MVKTAKATDQAVALGKRLRAERKKTRQTQKEVAKAVGCAQQTVLDLENGNVEWSRYLPDIAKHLGVSVAWLTTGEGPTDRSKSLGKPVPVVQWDYFTQLGTQEVEIEADDWLEGCPARHQGAVAAVIADEAIAFSMTNTVSQGDILFVDRTRSDPGLVVCVLAAWHRAEVRELTTSGGTSYLKASNPDLPQTLMPVTVFTDREAYRAALAQPGMDSLPCLVLGRVIFQGVMR